MIVLKKFYCVLNNAASPCSLLLSYAVKFVLTELKQSYRINNSAHKLGLDLDIKFAHKKNLISDSYNYRYKIKLICYKCSISYQNKAL